MRDSSSRVERLRTPRGRKSKSAVVLAFVVPVTLALSVCHEVYKQCVNTGLDARSPGLMLAMHGHIETFSKMPKWFYRLFDVLVGLDPSHQDAAGPLRL
ncbi:hypothetical protein CDL15_Pgr017493 [Punica granatum]|uniref:Uncharacterized protein n=1 Tax=Punica granatum TaxID=22663 RepID=A0A218XI76_PUNGR|nr:hypothetical protein CDL15_Pgr017493 [Punica granatum]